MPFSSHLKKPDIVIHGIEFLSWSQPALYIWRRGQEYLYIGTSRKPMQRIVLHNVIGKTEPVLAADVIEVYFADWGRLIYIEEDLNKRYQPKYSTQRNMLANSTDLSPRLCVGCKKLFTPNRFWQKYCTQTCRNRTIYKPEAG